MLTTECYIDSPASAGGDIYTLALYYGNPSMAKFVRLGDILTDTNTNAYEVILPTSLPLIDGTTITVQAVGTNILPQQDSAYNSNIETPGQIDSTPEITTGGDIDSFTLVSGPNYTYRVSASWSSSSEANASIVGDSIVDESGKEFQIVSFDTPAVKWGDTVIVEESEKEGVSPAIGSASLFRGTNQYRFYQGTPITDPARTVAYNRDSFYQDLALSGGTGVVSFTKRQDTGVTIAALTPIGLDSVGKLDTLDVSSEDSSFSVVGIIKEAVDHTNDATVVTKGRIENTGLGFAFREPLFVSKTGVITDTKPSIGVDGFAVGDWVISIGKLIENSITSGQKDLEINIRVVGQL